MSTSTLARILSPQTSFIALKVHGWKARQAATASVQYISVYVSHALRMQNKSKPIYTKNVQQYSKNTEKLTEAHGKTNHRTSPNNWCIFVNQKTNRHTSHSMVLNWNHLHVCKQNIVTNLNEATMTYHGCNNKQNGTFVISFFFKSIFFH